MLNSYFQCFDWDEGNREKCRAHGVSIEEIESALLNNAMFMIPDARHSKTEHRYIATGQTLNGRHLFVAFVFRTIDGNRALRPISARYMHKKEAKRYEQARADTKE